LKIALIHFSAPPVCGGVERVIGEQIQTLKQMGHIVSLACFEGEGAGANSHIPLSRTSSCSEFVAYLASALSGNDVIFMHNVCTRPDVPALTEALRLLPLKIPSARWICWVHDFALTDPDYAGLENSTHARAFARACEGWEYVAVSELRAREVEQWLEVPCTVIPNGVDPSSVLQLSPKIAALAEAQGWWSADAVILQPSRLLPRKAVEGSIQLTRALKERGFDLRVLLTGGADLKNPAHAVYYKYLRTLADSLRVGESVCFLGGTTPVGPKAYCDFHQIADALFFPGSQEGFGLPVLEAGVFGKPVFCSDSEPLRQLPGAVTYSSDLSVEDLATWFIGRIREYETITARRKILRDYRWPSIYHNHIEPLLKRSPHPYHP
jgi:glycosyltransferase involved in cell wall biosynthesis